MLRLSALALLATACHGLDYDEILNDFGAGVEGSGANWAEGWYTPCGDSFGPQEPVDFHHDGASAGLTTASYSPVLPEAGCYEVYEWHPGQNPGCASYLPTNALITVYSGDEATEVTVDQSQNAGQWNSLGLFDMSPGQHHYAVASNRGGGLDCKIGTCFWIADAMRFRHAGSSCAQPATREIASQAASRSQKGHTADTPPERLHADCADFVPEMGRLLNECVGVSSCDEMHEACSLAAATFNAAFQERMLKCMLQPEVREELQTRPDMYADMELLATCIVESEAEGALEGSMQVEAAAAAATAVSRPKDLAAAVKWDGKCEDFKNFAMEVMHACNGVRCCADVMENPKCTYLATGLYSLFPSEAFNACIDQVQIPCTCLLRKATSCALQGQMHEILYKQPWHPECVNEIMPYQLTPGEGGGGDELADAGFGILFGSAGLFVLAMAMLGAAFLQWVKMKRRAAVMERTSAAFEIAQSVELADGQHVPVALVQVVQNPSGELVVASLAADAATDDAILKKEEQA